MRKNKMKQVRWLALVCVMSCCGVSFASMPMRWQPPCPPKTQVKKAKLIVSVVPVRKESRWVKAKKKDGSLSNKLDQGRVVTDTVYLVKRVFKGKLSTKYVRIRKSCWLGWLPLWRLRYRGARRMCRYDLRMGTKTIVHRMPVPGGGKARTKTTVSRVKHRVQISSLPANHPLAKGKSIVKKMKGKTFFLFSQVLKVGAKGRVFVQRFSHRGACPELSRFAPKPSTGPRWPRDRKAKAKMIERLLK
jgi:hypothetical protein